MSAICSSAPVRAAEADGQVFLQRRDELSRALPRLLFLDGRIWPARLVAREASGKKAPGVTSSPGARDRSRPGIQAQRKPAVNTRSARYEFGESTAGRQA